MTNGIKAKNKAMEFVFIYKLLSRDSKFFIMKKTTKIFIVHVPVLSLWHFSPFDTFRWVKEQRDTTKLANWNESNFFIKQQKRENKIKRIKQTHNFILASAIYVLKEQRKTTYITWIHTQIYRLFFCCCKASSKKKIGRRLYRIKGIWLQ